MTAPTPERRVGEDVLRHFIECAEAWDPYACLVGNVTAQACAGIGCDLLDAEKEVARLTAEVERLRGVVEEAARLLGNEGNPAAEAYYLAALSLPTHAPEATNNGK